MTESKRKSLLFTLTPGQVSSLIRDKDLEDSGYTFNYVIDTFDIVKYCFPLGLHEDGERSVYLIADQQVALDDFFARNSTSVYILNEYYDELMGLRRRLVRNFNEVSRGISLEVQKFEKRLEGKWNPSDLIGDNLSLITSLLITARGGSNNFSRLFKERHILLEDDVLENKGLDLLDVPDASENQELLRTIFAQFSFAIDRSDSFYLDLYQKSQPNELTYFQFIDQRKKADKRSAYLDSLVMQRVFALNSKFDDMYHRGEIERNHVFLYISSAPRSKVVIDKLRNRWPIVNGEPLNILRSDAQLFAKLVLRSFEKEHFDHLRAIILLDSGKASDRLFDIIENERNKFENYNLLREYSSFIENINNYNKINVFNETTAKYIEDVRELIGENLHKVRENIDRINLAWIQLDLYEGLNCIINSDTATFQTRSFQRDPIESVKQQLPVVFDCRALHHSELSRILSEISYFFCLQKPNKAQVAHFRGALKEFFEIETEGSYSSSLVMFLLSLIVPVPGNLKTDPNTIVFNHITTVLKRDFNGSPFGLDSDPLSADFFVRELKYIQVWAARRAQKYHHGLTLSLKYADQYANDGRFWHSACLITYSWNTDFSQSRVREKPTLTLDRAIEFGEKAIRLYSDMALAGIDEANHSIETLHNTVAHLYFRSAESHLDNVDASSTDFLKGKEHYRLLVEIVGNQNLRKYSEYLATSALMYFTDAIIMMKSEAHSVQDIETKLNQARDIATTLREKDALEHNQKALDAFKKNVEALLRKLQDEDMQRGSMSLP